jgi:hypothetical protein
MDSGEEQPARRLTLLEAPVDLDPGLARASACANVSTEGMFDGIDAVSQWGIDHTILSHIIRSGNGRYHRTSQYLNLPAVLAIDSPAVPELLPRALDLIDHSLLDFTVHTIEVAADFSIPNASALLPVLFWQHPLQHAARAAFGWHTTFYWYPSRSRDLAFVPTPGSGLFPMGVYDEDRRAPIRAYIRPATGVLRLEVALSNAQLHALFLARERQRDSRRVAAGKLPKGHKKHVTLRRCLHSLDDLCALCHRRFAPFFEGGYLPEPHVPNWYDMQAVRAYLKHHPSPEELRDTKRREYDLRRAQEAA